MGGPDQPTAPGPVHGKFQAASLLISPRPNEFGFPLREGEFQILCEGEVNEARAGRNFFLGLALSATVGLVSLAATVDWDAALHQGRKGPLAWMAILIVLLAAPGAAAIVHHKRYIRTRNDSAYSRLRKRISEFFSSQVP